MLSEERHSIIVELVNSRGSVKLSELCEELDASESTIRRDLNVLSKRGIITKVHGGAISNTESFFSYENDVEKKSILYVKEKEKIAQYAASVIEDGDLVF